MAKKAAADLFAPPTKEELQSDLFAPPTDEELKEPGFLEKAKETGRGFLKGTLEALPTAGSIAGGVSGTALGAATGGIGAIPGGISGTALGAAAGKTLQNIGEKYLLGEEKTLPEVYGGPAKAALEGATAEMGGQLIGPAATKIGEGLKNIAETQAFKSTGAMLKDFRQAASKDQVNKIGRFLIDKGIVKAGDTFEDVASKSDAIRSEAGKKIDSIYAKAQEAIPNITNRETGFNPIRDKEEIISAVKKTMKDEVGASNAVQQVESYLNELGLKYGDKVLDPKISNDIKGAVDRAINYSRNPLNKQPTTEQAFSATRKILEKRIAKDVDFLGEKIGQEDLAKSLRQANKEYGMSTNVFNIADDRISREGAKNALSLTDTIAGGAGGAAGAIVGGAPGALIGGAATALTNKLAKKYGGGLITTGADLASKGLLSPMLQSQLLKQAPKGLVRGQ